MTEKDKNNIGTDPESRYLGEQLLITMNSLFQSIRIYKDNNQLVVNATNKLIKTVGQLLDEDGQVDLVLTNSRFFIHDEKLMYHREAEAVINNMIKYFDKRLLNGLQFFDSILKIAPQDLLAFIHCLNDSENHDEPLELIKDFLEEHDVEWVEIVETQEIDELDQGEKGDKEEENPEPQRPKEETKKGRREYSFALTSIREVSSKITQTKRAGIRKTVRVVQELVDLVIGQTPELQALTTLRVHDDYTYIHSVNVSILSMYLGEKIGLSKKSLERLGVCALFHDLGKAMIPLDILNKEGQLTRHELIEMTNHSLYSVRMIMRLRASHARKAQLLLPPFEHHLKYNLQGYPDVNWRRPITLFGRVIAIADVYDALTSVRIYRKKAMSPHRALGIMLDASGIDFDPVLMKVFANMLGIYPLGTLLLLDDGTMGLVAGKPPSGDIQRPLLLELEATRGGGYRKGEMIDLSEKNPRTKTYNREILKSFHPSVYDIQPTHFLT